MDVTMRIFKSKQSPLPLLLLFTQSFLLFYTTAFTIKTFAFPSWFASLTQRETTSSFPLLLNPDEINLTSDKSSKSHPASEFLETRESGNEATHIPNNTYLKQREVAIKATEDSSSLQNISQPLTAMNEKKITERAKTGIENCKLNEKNERMVSVIGCDNGNREVDNMDICNDDIEIWHAPLYIQEYFPYYLTGYDDEQRPIWFAEVGKFKLNKIREEKGDSFLDLEKYSIQAACRILRSIIEQNKTSDWEVKEAIHVIDFDGLDMFQFADPAALALIFKVTKSFLSVFAQHWGINININVNYAAEMLLNVLRPVLGRAMEKVEIYGTNKAKWMPVLRRKLPLETIPTHYGGFTNFKPAQLYG